MHHLTLWATLLACSQLLLDTWSHVGITLCVYAIFIFLWLINLSNLFRPNMTAIAKYVSVCILYSNIFVVGVIKLTLCIGPLMCFLTPDLRIDAPLYIWATFLACPQLLVDIWSLDGTALYAIFVILWPTNISYICFPNMTAITRYVSVCHCTITLYNIYNIFFCRCLAMKINTALVHWYMLLTLALRIDASFVSLPRFGVSAIVVGWTVDPVLV